MSQWPDWIRGERKGKPLYNGFGVMVAIAVVTSTCVGDFQQIYPIGSTIMKG